MAYQTLSYTPPYLQAQPGSEVRAGGGGGYPVVGARSALDMRRMMQTGRTPDAQYPDGYLTGAVPNDRHQDKLLANYGSTTRYDRPYDRGVHKGERLDRQAYSWPSWLSPTAGIQRQMRTQRRWAPQGHVPDVPSMPGSNAQPATASPLKAADLAKFAPTWR